MKPGHYPGSYQNLPECSIRGPIPLLPTANVLSPVVAFPLSLKMDTLPVYSIPPNTQWDHTLYPRCLLKMRDFPLLSEPRRRFAFPPGARVTVPVCLLQVYLLILSVTTLSLLLAPVLWKAAITKCVPRPERRSSL